MLSYVNQLGIVKNTLEVQEALAYGSCFSKHLSHVLKISACLYINQLIMHLVCFFCLLIKLWLASQPNPKQKTLQQNLWI